MARASKDKKTRNRTNAGKPKSLGRTPDDIWLRNPEVIRRFLDVRRDYEQLCAEVEYILRKKIGDQAIETSAITSRAKTLNSFLEKLQRKQYNSPFDDLTDLAGVRVVCLYHSDIAKVAEIIHSEFAITEDVDKLDELHVDQFGYGARHFIVRLGKTSSGARYDDLKQMPCEVQVRTVVQDAWAIIQHHLVYKRESQVPTQLQRKLNSLAGLFETVDDQFERIREEREAYLTEVRSSASQPSAFLEHELNLDSFKEHLKWTFPDRAIESWDGQARYVLDNLLVAGLSTLREVDHLIKETATERHAVYEERGDRIVRAADGTVPSVGEAVMALWLTGEEMLDEPDDWKEIIRKHRVVHREG